MSITKEKELLGEKFFRQNHVDFEVTGDLALFSDPITSVGGEKTTYSVPTYEALKGVAKSIYWKPTFIWVIDKVRIMNLIRTETIGTKLPRINGDGQDLANYTYLLDVRYQVQAHLIWNMNRAEFEQDRNFRKHYACFAKALLKGGRLAAFLGKSECCAEVLPCEFGAENGAYDNTGVIGFGYMYHGITYPDEAYSDETKGRMTIDLAPVQMMNGVIEYPSPEHCLHKTIRAAQSKIFEQKGVKMNATAQ